MRRRASQLALMVAGLWVVVLCLAEPTARVERVATSAPVFVDVSRARRIEAWFAITERQQDAAFLAAVHTQEGTTGAQAPQERTYALTHYEPGTIEALICSVFTEDCAGAVRVARCESNLNPQARNRSGALGLFQLLGHGDLFAAHGWDVNVDWSDPYRNTVVAHDLWSSSGWRPWVCAR